MLTLSLIMLIAALVLTIVAACLKNPLLLCGPVALVIIVQFIALNIPLK